MVYAFIFLALLGSTMLFLIARTYNKHPYERGRLPILKSVGEGKIGSSHFRTPFFRLALYEEALVLSSAKKLLIPLSAISEVSPSRFKDGHLEIKFHAPSEWPFVSVKTKKNAKFEAELINLIKS